MVDIKPIDTLNDNILGQGMAIANTERRFKIFPAEEECDEKDLCINLKEMNEMMFK